MASVDNVYDIAPINKYVASSGQTVFDYDFPIFDAVDLRVYVGDVLQSIGTDYTVQGEGNENGGTVTFTSGRSSGQQITIYRLMPIERLTDMAQNGPMRAADFNQELDRITMYLQEVRRDMDRSLRFGILGNSPSPELSPIDNWKDRYLYVDSSGALVPTVDAGSTPINQEIIGDLFFPETPNEIAEDAAPVAPYITPSHKSMREVLLNRYLTDAQMNGDGDITDQLNWAIAVAQSSGAMKVVLPPGAMNISDTINADGDGISIVGAGMFSSVLTQTEINKHGFRVNANRALLMDLQITGVGSTNNVEWRGIYLPGTDDVSIIRCAVLGTSGAGIYMGQISDGNDPTQTRSERGRIIDCLIEDATGPGNQGCGIEIAGGIDCIVRGNIVRRTKVHGIRINGGVRCIVDGNIVEDAAQLSGMTGIYVATATMPGPALVVCTDTTVTNNIVRFVTPKTSGAFTGIGVIGATDIIIKGNRVMMDGMTDADDSRGIDVITASLPIINERITISDNNVSGDGYKVGIGMQSECDGVIVSGNHVTGYVTAGIRDTGSGIRGAAFGNVMNPGIASAYGILKGSGSGLMTGFGNVVLDTNTNSAFAATAGSFTPGFGPFRRLVTRVAGQSRLEIASLASHPLETGDRIRFSTTGVLPDPLAPDTDYFATRVSDTRIGVATSLANAVSGTEITLTDGGSGTHTVVSARTNWGVTVG